MMGVTDKSVACEYIELGNAVLAQAESLEKPRSVARFSIVKKTR